jgi:hypothetical protein
MNIHTLKPKIAHSNQWAIQVSVDEETGNVFYRLPNSQITLPFVTEEKYTLIDATDLRSLGTKYIFAEMRIKALQKQVDANYSSAYLTKYFNEKSIDVPKLEVVNHIVTRYSAFLEHSVFGDSKTKWGAKTSAIKAKELSRIDRDVEMINLFMEFLTDTEEISEE